MSNTTDPFLPSTSEAIKEIDKLKSENFDLRLYVFNLEKKLKEVSGDSETSLLGTLAEYEKLNAELKTELFRTEEKLKEAERALQENYVEIDDIKETMKKQTIENEQLSNTVTQQNEVIEQRSRIIDKLLSKLEKKVTEIQDLKQSNSNQDNAGAKRVNFQSVDGFAQTSVKEMVEKEESAEWEQSYAFGAVLSPSLRSNASLMSTQYKDIALESANDTMDDIDESQAVDAMSCSKIEPLLSQSLKDLSQMDDAGLRSVNMFFSGLLNKLDVSVNYTTRDGSLLEEIHVSGRQELSTMSEGGISVLKHKRNRDTSPRRHVLEKSLNNLLHLDSSSCGSLNLSSVDRNRLNLVQEIWEKVTHLREVLLAPESLQISLRNNSFPPKIETIDVEVMTDDVQILYEEQLTTTRLQEEKQVNEQLEVNQEEFASKLLHWNQLNEILTQENDSLNNKLAVYMEKASDQDVTIEILKTKLNENENLLHEKENEIQQIIAEKDMMSAYRDDVEDQLAQFNDIISSCENLLIKLMDTFIQTEDNGSTMSSTTNNELGQLLLQCQNLSSHKGEKISQLLGDLLAKAVSSQQDSMKNVKKVQDQQEQVNLLTRKLEKEKNNCKRLLNMQNDTNSKLHVTLEQLSMIGNEINAKNREIQRLSGLVEQLQRNSNYKNRSTVGSQTDFTLEHWHCLEKEMTQVKERLHVVCSQHTQRNAEALFSHCEEKLPLSSAESSLNQEENHEWESKLKQTKQRYQASLMEYEQQHRKYQHEMEVALSSIVKIVNNTAKKIENI